jgi:hypothetical protein
MIKVDNLEARWVSLLAWISWQCHRVYRYGVRLHLQTQALIFRVWVSGAMELLLCLQ